MATKPKFDSVNDDKRPLRLECKGGPYTFMRVDEQRPLRTVPIPEETGGPAIAGHYHLQGSVYVYEANR